MDTEQKITFTKNHSRAALFGYAVMVDGETVGFVRKVTSSIPLVHGSIAYGATNYTTWAIYSLSGTRMGGRSTRKAAVDSLLRSA